MMSCFADELKNLRMERGLTQTALARELQVTQNAVFNWENGKREPSMEMIRKIADYFQVSAAYLFAENEIYRTALRFLDEFSTGKAPTTDGSPWEDRGGSKGTVPKAAKEPQCDFMIKDEAGNPLIIIECTETDKSHERLLAHIRKYIEWCQKTYEPLNEDGRCKVAEYAELLSGAAKFQRKPEEPA